MRKGVAILTGVLVLVALAAAAASAATPDKTVVSFDDPALEAAIAGDLTKACHTPISVDLSGKVEITVLNKTQAAGALEVDAYETRGTFTNVETGTTASLVDVGPDVLKYDAKKGTVLLAITGRSITGSGVIGRVLIDLDSGEILSVAGLVKGHWVENLCSELT